jgi:uncharacterized protein YaaQ
MMPDQNIDFLVLVVVSQAQSKILMANLNQDHFYFTIIDSHSSLFREPTICLLLGLSHHRLEELNDLVSKYCQPFRKYVPVQLHALGELSPMPILESLEGGAILYGMPVEHFEQI